MPAEVLGEAGPDQRLSHQINQALTASQTKVLRLLLTGLRNREIASALNITEGTVKQHVHAVPRTRGHVAGRRDRARRLGCGGATCNQGKSDSQGIVRVGLTDSPWPVAGVLGDRL